MLFRATILPLLFAVTGWAQLTFTVPVTDRSGSGNPLEISGNISFSESVTEGMLSVSTSYDIAAKNSSSKTIVLLVATLDEKGPHGRGAQHVFQFDNFFRQGFLAGESFTLARIPPDQPHITCCTNVTEEAGDPRGDVRVVYVRFSDGTSFGDESVSKEILEIETQVLQRLRELDAVSSAEQFEKLLAQKMRRPEAEAFLETLRRVQREQGTATARKQVRVGIAYAEQHMAGSETAQAVRQ